MFVLIIHALSDALLCKNAKCMFVLLLPNSSSMLFILTRCQTMFKQKNLEHEIPKWYLNWRVEQVCLTFGSEHNNYFIFAHFTLAKSGMIYELRWQILALPQPYRSSSIIAFLVNIFARKGYRKVVFFFNTNWTFQCLVKHNWNIIIQIYFYLFKRNIILVAYVLQCELTLNTLKTWYDTTINENTHI